MSKIICFNVFEMNCVGYQLFGLWVYLCDCLWQYKDFDYWIDFVCVFECGIFDVIFIVDVIGYYDVYKGSNYYVLYQVVQILVNDLLQFVVLIVMVIEYFGIGIIVLMMFEYLYMFVCWLLIVDYYMKGWFVWNIVMLYLESGVKNVGDYGLCMYDDCYVVVVEYVEVLYKLFEGSWEDGVVVCDCDGCVFMYLEKVYEIGYKGCFFDVFGYYLCELLLQCMLVFFQVGVLGLGKVFVVQYVECVFVVVLICDQFVCYVVDVCVQVVVVGCDLVKVLIYNFVMVIVDEIDEKV